MPKEKDIAIATVSLVRTKEEGEVILETIKDLSKLGIPIVVVDGGSPGTSLKRIKKLPNVFFFSGKGGLNEQLILSQKEAAKKAPYLFFLQVDKLDFAKSGAGEMFKFYRGLKNKGLLLMSRTRKSLNSYPPFQKKQEAFLNFFMGDYMGITNDYFSGVKIYPSSLVRYLDQIQGEVGWGIEAFLCTLAKRVRLPIDFFKFNLDPPKDVEDELNIKLYRLKITEWEIRGFLAAQKVKL